MKKAIDQEKTREKIVALRTERGLSQNQLAEALGASRTHYNGIEHGKATITNSYINMLAEFYDVPVEDIVVAVGADQFQQQGVIGTFQEPEEAVLPTRGTAMQAVRAVVLWQPYGAAVDSDEAVAQPVGIAANDGTKVGEVVLTEVVFGAVEP